MTKAAELAKMGEVLTNSQIGGRRNMIINGAMQVAQRGTSSTDSSYGTVDRFAISRGAVTATQSQESLASGDTPYSLGFRKYFRITNTGTTSATNSYIAIRHRIEAQNIAMSGWNYTSTSSDITISFWVRSSLAGTYYMNLRSNDGTAQNYTIPVVLSANTWTKIIKTVSGDSGISIDNDNGIGLDVLMWAHLGTDYTTSSHTINQWNTYSGTDQAPDYSQNWNNTSSATFDLTGVQLEVGSQATPFEHRSVGEELDLCQRYFFQGGRVHAVAIENGTTNIRLTYPVYKVMRATPTITCDNTGVFYTTDLTDAAADNYSALTALPKALTGSIGSVLHEISIDFSSNPDSNDDNSPAFLNTNGTMTFDAEL